MVSESRRNLVLTVVCLALVLVMAGVAMLNLALPSIARDLGASQSQQQWIIDGYTVVLAALLLPLGALGDRLGRRPMLLTGIAVFGLAAVPSAMVDTTGMLIALRALLGVGAAMIMPATLATITNVFPAEERARPSASGRASPGLARSSDSSYQDSCSNTSGGDHCSSSLRSPRSSPSYCRGCWCRTRRTRPTPTSTAGLAAVDHRYRRAGARHHRRTRAGLDRVAHRRRLRRRRCRHRCVGAVVVARRQAAP